jgi:hypothetical protein
MAAGGNGRGPFTDRHGHVGHDPDQAKVFIEQRFDGRQRNTGGNGDDQLAHVQVVGGFLEHTGHNLGLDGIDDMISADLTTSILSVVVATLYFSLMGSNCRSLASEQMMFSGMAAPDRINPSMRALPMFPVPIIPIFLLVNMDSISF